MGEILHGDCRELMGQMSPESIDAIVTDPPYGLAFMGKAWDHAVPGEEYWRQAWRVAKPGAHMLAFGGTRLYHRLTCAIEDAGWEIRDCLMWVYGSGFPKSHNISKAIDKAAGVDREVVGSKLSEPGYHLCGHAETGKFGSGIGGSTPETRLRSSQITAPATDAAKQWDGWGTALKPAWEPILLARKPFKGTVANNVLEHGCGGLDIDGCRVGTEEVIPAHHGTNGVSGHTMGNRNEYIPGSAGQIVNTQGRFPANLIHDGSEEVVGLFPVTGKSSKRTGKRTGIMGEFKGQEKVTMGHDDDKGSAARYFYCPKASKADRGENNKHPTVKPHDLMRYLCRLITPPSGIVLDPFCGSGSTGKAAVAEGFGFIGCEIDQEYSETARQRTRRAC